MFDDQRFLADIAFLCHRLQVTRLDLFGSATTENFGPSSDVDVLVEFEHEVDGLFDRYFSLKEGLERLFGRPVDVVMAGAIRNPYFKAAVEKSRRSIYAA